MKKVIALLLSLIMVFAMSVPAFAETENKAPVYFAIGDSVGAGYAIDDDYWWGWQSSLVNGEKVGKFAFVKGAYPSDFLEMISYGLNKANPDSYDATYPGFRAKDMCYVLETKSFDSSKEREGYGKENTFDSFLNNGFGGMLAPNCVEQMHSYKAELDKKIKNADVISIQLGNNDFSEFMITSLMLEGSEGYLYDAIERLIGDISSKKLDNSIAALENAVKEYAKMPTPANAKALMKAFCDFDNALVSVGTNLSEVLKIFINDTINSVGNSMKYYNELAGYIREQNPDAIILAVNLYNPFDGMTAEGEEGQIIDLLRTMVEPLVNVVNSNIKVNASKYDYAVADIKAAGIIADEDLFFHPNYEGHKAIADLMKVEYDKAIKERMTAKTKSELVDEILELESELTDLAQKNHEDEAVIADLKAETASLNDSVSELKAEKAALEAEIAKLKCAHENTKIVKKTSATYLKKGYTGDTYCLDCDKVVKTGKEIAKKVPAKTSITKLSKGTKKFTVKWSKKSSITGYEVRYSTSKSFKNSKTVAVKSYKTTKKTVKNLKKNKKYYVKVRTYKNVKNSDGKYVKCTSSWSAVKTVTTK